MKSKAEVTNKVSVHWKSGFCKESQCNYAHTDEDCFIPLQGLTRRYSKCRDIQGQTGTDKVRQGQTGTDRDRQGQAGTSMGRQRQTETSRDGNGMSLLVPACPCLSLSCPCLSLLCPSLSLRCPWH